MMKTILVLTISATLYLLPKLSQAQESIRSMSTPQLLRVLSEVEDPFAGSLRADTATDELLKRGNIPGLIEAYNHPINRSEQDELMEGVFSQIRTKRVEAFMESHRADSVGFAEYYVVGYLADLGDRKALAILNKHLWDWPTSSWGMSYDIPMFAKYKYWPAVPNIIDCLDAASGNLAGAAYDAIYKFYPHAKRNFDSIKAMQKYFRKLAHEK